MRWAIMAGPDGGWHPKLKIQILNPMRQDPSGPDTTDPSGPPVVGFNHFQSFDTENNPLGHFSFS